VSTLHQPEGGMAAKNSASARGQRAGVTLLHPRFRRRVHVCRGTGGGAQVRHGRMRQQNRGGRARPPRGSRSLLQASLFTSGVVDPVHLSKSDRGVGGMW
jgi:hypothetical protein